MPSLTRRMSQGGNKTLRKLVSLITPEDELRTLIHNADKPKGRAETNVFDRWFMRFRMMSNHTIVFPTLTHENEEKRRRNEKRKNSNLPIPPMAKQSVHRLSLRTWKTEEDLHLLFKDGFEVSHLCHNIKCYNPSHLTIESRESRTNCGIRRRCICGLLSMANG